MTQAPAVLPPISPSDAAWFLERAGMAAMEAGLRPARKFKTVTGDRPAFHPPRSRADLTSIQGGKDQTK
jgi:hypothetical protein